VGGVDYRLGVCRSDHPCSVGYLQNFSIWQPCGVIFTTKAVNHIAAEIVLVLAAYWQGAASRAARPSERMEAMLDYIREHLRLPLTRQSLAETFNLTPGYINQLFKVELGMSPSAVINAAVS
jgi:YesN/AraC family two-component response regulator